LALATSWLGQKVKWIIDALEAERIDISYRTKLKLNPDELNEILNRERAWTILAAAKKEAK
jgi:hypothetical protein